MLSTKRINGLKAQLNNHFLELREEISQELLASGNDQIAGQVHDLGDESLTEMLADINSAMIDHHIKEIKEIESALLRIDSGTYGICIDCNTPIKYKRLEVQPAAARCINCQALYETDHKH